MHELTVVDFDALLAVLFPEKNDTRIRLAKSMVEGGVKIKLTSELTPAFSDGGYDAEALLGDLLRRAAEKLNEAADLAHSISRARRGLKNLPDPAFKAFKRA